MDNYCVPFKTPVDYWVDGLDRNADNMKLWHEIRRSMPMFAGEDADLHVYPYVDAVPAMLSMGCPNRCDFCPTAKEHKGTVTYGEYEAIIKAHAGQNVHWMDENFFRHPELPRVLDCLRQNNVKWLAMSDCRTVHKVFDEFGPEHLIMSGCKCIEVGLENVVHMMKVKKPLPRYPEIEIYYLNMSLFPGETKESIRENGKWMLENGLRRPIHFNNGLWYAPGQFYYPYGESMKDGEMLPGEFARTRPTYVPDSLLDQDAKVVDLEKANYYSQLVYGIKMYPQWREFNIRSFLNVDSVDKMCWLAVGLRIGAIV